MFGNVVAHSKFLDWALVLTRPLDLLLDRVHGLVGLVVALLEETVIPLLRHLGLLLGLPPLLRIWFGVRDLTRS